MLVWPYKQPYEMYNKLYDYDPLFGKLIFSVGLLFHQTALNAQDIVSGIFFYPLSLVHLVYFTIKFSLSVKFVFVQMSPCHCVFNDLCSRMQ